MGRILEYVVLLSNLSLILGVPHYKETSHGSNYEREKQENFTQVVKQHFPKDQNEFFNKRVLELEPRRMLVPPKHKPMRTSLGLHAYASDTLDWKARKRNFSEANSRNSNLSRKSVLPPFSQALYPRKNSKNLFFHGEIPSQRLSRPHNLNNSFNNQNKDVIKRYHKEGRNSRHHPRQPVKICDPCNSVPWIPLLKVPDSYRQQRTHVTELHPTPQENFKVDYHGFASDAQKVFLPPIPLVPPLEPVYDGTISSSFGLPAGNIPTSHGLLAPINQLATHPTLDYSNPFNFFSSPGLLESNPFPELSPVPIVPIHDSTQFYNFDSTIPDLVPPPNQNVDVSKVVLTISEENLPDLQPPKPPLHNHKIVSSDANAISPPEKKDKSKDSDSFEIVQSIPLAEFTSSVHVPDSDLPLYPPLQSEYSTDFGSKKEIADRPSAKSATDVTFTTQSAISIFSQSSEKSEPQGEYSAPKPLTSPSISWLFSDHTAPPSDSKASASVSSFVTETQEIASVVNNELRPVSPPPLPVGSQNGGNAKTKKIQIIIPYTTKNKKEHDNNALESVRHEVFQPPLSKANDFANSVPPSLTRTEPNRAIDGIESGFKEDDREDHKTRKYLNEMHHIIASNIRELLREEIEKSQKEQNYSLQNNIDNWTALEYSNHKTLETKAPKEIISQALAVTSIPGTSISHLLLPSKKIPNEYLVTTSAPDYDEPSTVSYKATNSTVNSSPFTAKPYATTSIYTSTRSLGDTAKQKKENTPPLSNHENSYTEVVRGRVNNWGKLNENLVLPEARRKTLRAEQTTASTRGSLRGSSERLQIVTPVPLTTQRNYTTTSFRRTTREVRRSEDPTTATPILKQPFLNRLNSTRLEKVSNLTVPFVRKFTYNTTTNQIRNSPRSVSRANSSVIVVEASSVGNRTSEDPKLNGKSEHFSINDVFPFRNKELPWESNKNNSQNVYRRTGERKSLIKQVNLPKSRVAAGSS